MMSFSKLKKYIRRYIPMTPRAVSYLPRAIVEDGNGRDVSINILSSRSRCLEHTLASLWNRFNRFYDRDVYVYYFDDIFSVDSKVRKKIERESIQKVFFRQIEYKLPSNLKDSELFFNMPRNAYAKKFGEGRAGYLHMCHHLVNQACLDGVSASKYRYAIWHDDEGGYTQDITEDPVAMARSMEGHISAYVVGQRLKDGSPHLGHLETRVGLFDFVQTYCQERAIVPKNKALAGAIKSNDESCIHLLEWCDTYIIDTKLFSNSNWIEYISEVNQSGGIYRYRWGDNEIFSLFAHIYEGSIGDVGLVKQGVYDQGMFRDLQPIAPSVNFPYRR